jgi:hypothetical protein
MKKKATEQPESKGLVEKKPRALVLEGDPEAQLAYASKAATALMKVVEAKPKKVMIKGKQYLEYGSWQTLGAFFGATAGVEWTKKIEENGKFSGYEARAIIMQKNIQISSAEASCMKSEANWNSRDEFAIKSMAQTRACAKALRNAFGWVAEMAGYESTPSEEMDAVMHESRMEPYVVARVVPADEDDPQGKRRESVIQIEDPVIENKMRIMRLLQVLDPLIDVKDGKMVKLEVESRTKLSLVEENFGDITDRLQILVDEKRGI